jgi:membrane-bound metal-dependent hydrolase YbcI (DUF457 family)
MSPLHHLLLAWLIANLIETDPWTRRFTLVIGAIPDIDGFSLLFSQDLFLAYHRAFTHTLVFGIVASAVLSVFVKKKAMAFSIFMLSFTTHIGSDIVGSFGVPVFAPFIWTRFSTSPFLSDGIVETVINPIVLIIGLAGAIAILVMKKRTPFEFISVKYDGMIVNYLILPFTSRCHVCGKRALFRCERCSRTACGSHVLRETQRIICTECESVT